MNDRIILAAETCIGGDVLLLIVLTAGELLVTSLRRQLLRT